MKKTTQAIIAIALIFALAAAGSAVKLTMRPQDSAVQNKPLGKAILKSKTSATPQRTNLEIKSSIESNTFGTIEGDPSSGLDASSLQGVGQPNRISAGAELQDQPKCSLSIAE